MILSVFLLVHLTAISFVENSVFDSIMSPTFMKPLDNSSPAKSEDLFSDFFDSKGSNDSFAALSRSMFSGGKEAANFNFSSIVPMSRSSSSTRLVSSHTSTKSESISTFPEKTETQGINLSKVVENVQLIGPRSNKELTKAVNMASVIGKSPFGFTGQVAEKELINKLTSERPINVNGLTNMLSSVNTAGRYFVVFPVISSENAQSFYVVEDVLPKDLLNTKVGDLLQPRRTTGGGARKQESFE